MEIGGIALRDVIIVVSGLTATYLVILLLRLVQIGRHKFVSHDEVLAAPASPPAPPKSANDAAVAVAAAPARPPAVAARPADGAAAPSFDAELERSSQDLDARQLREEVGQLRAELANVRDELDRIRATRNISPQYSDAMTMAERGLTAQDVADRCGISLGEAELIWALSRGPMKFDQEDEYGIDSRRKHARAA